MDECPPAHTPTFLHLCCPCSCLPPTLPFALSPPRPQDLGPMLRKLGGLGESELLEVYEEVKFEPSVMVDRLPPNTTLAQAQLEDGDILVFQRQLSNVRMWRRECGVGHPAALQALFCVGVCWCVGVCGARRYTVPCAGWGMDRL